MKIQLGPLFVVGFSGGFAWLAKGQGPITITITITTTMPRAPSWAWA